MRKIVCSGPKPSPTRIETWNVRTISDTSKLAQVIREMTKYNMAEDSNGLARRDGALVGQGAGLVLLHLYYNLRSTAIKHVQ